MGQVGVQFYKRIKKTCLGGGWWWQWGMLVAGGGLRQLMQVVGGRGEKNKKVQKSTCLFIFFLLRGLGQILNKNSINSF